METASKALAAIAPLALATIANSFALLCCQASPAITSAVSRIWGTCRGDTKLPKSISSNPTLRSWLMYAIFEGVGMKVSKPCIASRGHSTIFMFDLDYRIKGWITMIILLDYRRYTDL